MFKEYKKKLEKLFKREEIGRKQLNFACDVRLITRLKLLATYLETPFYPLAEHILQLGMAEVLTCAQDEALKVNLQHHLIQQHLLVGQLDPVESLVSERAGRIDNALKFLKLVEQKAGSVEAVEQIIGRILKEA
jgi:hypothetical protein